MGQDLKKIVALPSRRGVLLGGAAIAFAPSVARADDDDAVDGVLVLKGDRTLYLLKDGQRVKEFRVELGQNPVGPKRAKGDGRTPEGVYFVDGRNPNSPYHLSLHLSYPNDYDRILAQESGFDPGSDIAIHGMPENYGPYDPVFLKDWTEGCIAVGNRAIEEIYRRVRDGALVEIRA